MRKLVARKDTHMKDGKLFLIEGKEYDVIKETEKFLIIHSEISKEHSFTKDENDSSYVGKYFFVEEAIVEKEEVVVEETVVEEVKKKTHNQSKKHK